MSLYTNTRPLESFSLGHFITLGVFFLVIILVFAFRKFFNQNRLADKIFRFSLAFLILGFEIGYYFYAGFLSDDKFLKTLPKPLCGHVLWINSLALFANSKRIAKVIYPIGMTGGTLSMIFINMDANFPEFRAFHYFIIHGGFMLGLLYFFFTKKIVNFKVKDFLWSCFALFGAASYMFILSSLGVEDSYFLIDPPKALTSLKELFGQTGWTILYIIAIFLIMGVYSFLAHIFTLKRDENDCMEPRFKENIYLYKIGTLSLKAKAVILLMPVFVLNYFVVLQGLTEAIWLYYVDLFLLIFIIFLIILNEVSYNYLTYYGVQVSGDDNLNEEIVLD